MLALQCCGKAHQAGPRSSARVAGVRVLQGARANPRRLAGSGALHLRALTYRPALSLGRFLSCAIAVFANTQRSAANVSAVRPRDDLVPRSGWTRENARQSWVLVQSAPEPDVVPHLNAGQCSGLLHKTGATRRRALDGGRIGDGRRTYGDVERRREAGRRRRRRRAASRAARVWPPLLASTSRASGLESVMLS